MLIGSRAIPDTFVKPQRDVFVVDGAFASPRERSEGGVGAKSGFFSVRKKTAPTVSKHIKLRIDAADGDRELRIELPSEAGLGPWVVSSGAKEVRDTATTAAGGPTPTNSGGKIRIVNNILHTRAVCGLTSSEVCLQRTSVSFDVAVLDTFLPLQAGACIVPVHANANKDARRLLQQLKDSSISVVAGVPSQVWFQRLAPAFARIMLPISPLTLHPLPMPFKIWLTTSAAGPSRFPRMEISVFG